MFYFSLFPSHWQQARIQEYYIQMDHIYTHTHIDTYTHTHANTHTHKHIDTHTHANTHICICIYR